jgi:hypothetical protein
MIKRMIISTAILFAMLLLLLPKTDDTSKQKMASVSMLMCTKDYRAAIAEQVRRKVAVDLVFKNSCPDLISGVEVDETGELHLRNTTHSLSMVLTPLVEKNKVRWSCRGEPAELITSLCKP